MRRDDGFDFMFGDRHWRSRKEAGNLYLVLTNVCFHGFFQRFQRELTPIAKLAPNSSLWETWAIALDSMGELRRLTEIPPTHSPLKIQLLRLIETRTNWRHL